MIIVTGAAGFIGSCLVSKLNSSGYNNVVVVDDFSKIDKEENLKEKNILHRVERDEFISWIDENEKEIEFVFHLGARTDTTEFDEEIFNRLNLNYSKDVWRKCSKYQIPLVYASSAATYGLGEQGYNDNEILISTLKPLNPYGRSKNDFDIWALEQNEKPFFWAGLKFFNVYGPNEYHKGRMASVIFHAFTQIDKTSKMKLFRSHKEGIEDGQQMRDFVAVKDVIKVCEFLMHHRKDSGIYNLGSGKARTFLDLARSVFAALGKEEDIEFIDTPSDIRNTYQYFTEASVDKLRQIGYIAPFLNLEDGILDYVQNYLIQKKYL
jgi:ADP-L-glycero-D-manno-heptose 6-epimerase